MSINHSNYFLLLVLTISIFSCKSSPEKLATTNKGVLSLNASNKALVEAFDWAKNRALLFAHDNTDPVGYWYEAALPNREAFCMRDVSHQAIGAEILGLGQHNYNMFLKFAQNISKEKDYCTFWEINRYDKPAPVDYETDADFWYNLPANFDVTFSANRLYKWTGNKDYLVQPDLVNFYELSLNEYLDHWDLGAKEVTNRNRAMHLEEGKSRFGDKRGIPTYNEGGRGATLLGIDMTASIIAAYKAYAEMLIQRDEPAKAKEYKVKAQEEQAFLDDFWWDVEKQAFRSILYEDGAFDYFMVGKDQAFLHYLYYFEAISNDEKFKSIVDEYAANYPKLIVELKSYLPIIFYENGLSELANQMIIDLCSVDNKRRDYPENSFTVIEHLTRGLMGINVEAATTTFSTFPRLEKEENWVEMQNIPLLSNLVTVKHFGNTKTIATNVSGGTIKWSASLPGTQDFLYINGRKTEGIAGDNSRQPYTFTVIELKEGDEVTVATN